MIPADTVGVITPPLETLHSLARVRLREGLASLPWRPHPDRPGRWVRSLWFEGSGEFTEAVDACMDCHRVRPMLFVMTETVWASVARKLDFLCFGCAERRLGRPIRAADLKPDVPCNEELVVILSAREPSE